MTARKIACWFAALSALVAPSAALGQAQDAFCDEHCYHEQQWFAPVDFDFNCQPIDRGCGYFFNYSNLTWYLDNERTVIGQAGAVELSEDIWPEILALDPNDGPPQQYAVANGIQDATPGSFGQGNRYEFGYFNGQHSVSVGVVWDQTNYSLETYGNGPIPTGFGSLHVNFELQNPDLLLGFRDYGGVFVVTDLNDGDIPTPTINGPGIVPSEDGVVDDLNGNLAEGPVGIFADIDGDGDLDLIGIAVDYGDLYRFNVTFNEVTVRNTTRTDSVEVMKNYVLDNNHWFATEQNGQIEIGAGVRFVRIRDEFGFEGTSDLLRGATVIRDGALVDLPGNQVDTEVNNQIVGPQIYARYTKQMHRLQYGASGRFVFGYNVQDLDQRGVMGEGLLPGGLNQPAILQPTGFVYGQQENDFSPLVEFRADATYRLTSALALKLGYTAIFADNITRASAVTRWRLPDMGFNETGEQHIFMNGVDGGFELTY